MTALRNLPPLLTEYPAKAYVLTALQAGALTTSEVLEMTRYALVSDHTAFMALCRLAEIGAVLRRRVGRRSYWRINDEKIAGLRLRRAV